MNNFTEYIETELYSYLPDENCSERELIESMRYSLEAGGKRVRPQLVLEFNKIWRRFPLPARWR